MSASEVAQISYAMYNDDFPNISGAKYGIKACRGAMGSNFGAFSSTEVYRARSKSSYNSDFERTLNILLLEISSVCVVAYYLSALQVLLVE